MFQSLAPEYRTLLLATACSTLAHATLFGTFNGVPITFSVPSSRTTVEVTISLGNDDSAQPVTTSEKTDSTQADAAPAELITAQALDTYLPSHGAEDVPLHPIKTSNADIIKPNRSNRTEKSNNSPKISRNQAEPRTSSPNEPELLITAPAPAPAPAPVTITEVSIPATTQQPLISGSLQLSPSTASKKNTSQAQAGTSRAPTAIEVIEPVYPSTSRRRGEEGRVVIEVFLNEKGSVLSAKIIHSSGFSRLDNAAVKAAEATAFLYAMDQGIAINSTLQLPYRFELK